MTTYSDLVAYLDNHTTASYDELYQHLEALDHNDENIVNAIDRLIDSGYGHFTTVNRLAKEDRIFIYLEEAEELISQLFYERGSLPNFVTAAVDHLKRHINRLK